MQAFAQDSEVLKVSELWVPQGGWTVLCSQFELLFDLVTGCFGARDV